MHSEPDLKRLCAALLLSGLLHVLLFFMSFAGVGSRAPLLVLTDTRPVLTAHLYKETGNKIPSVGQPREGANTAASDRRREHEAAPDEAQNPPGKKEIETASKDRFFAADQLTKHPLARDKVDLNIPEARVLTAPGSLVLNLWINNLGEVVSIEIEKTTFPAEYAAAAAETFGSVRFEPGEIHGRPVNSIVKIEITHDAASPSPP
jgi:hypothetical protein